MEDLTVDSIELEYNAHPDEDDHSTLLGNTGCKNSVLITPSDKKN